MDPRLEVLTRPRDGASATVEEEHGATTVTLSWADGAELQAVQYRENDVIHAYLHGCGTGHEWASAAHVEIFLETLASHPTRRWRSRFSTRVGFADHEWWLGSRFVLQGRLPDASFPALPGGGSAATWFALFDDGWLVAHSTAGAAIATVGAPEEHGSEAQVFSSDGRILRLHEGYDGYDGILGVDCLPLGGVTELLRSAKNPTPTGLDDAALMAWHIENSRSAVRTI